MSSFADFGVPAPLCATLARRGITEPFPIQAATLPDALAGRDVAGKAPTGSGKTLAFGLTIAARAAKAGALEPRRPRALVLVPTRELAAQVQRELTALIDERAHGPVVAIYGGVGYGPQRKALARGVSAVVACPGRLEDLIATGDVRLDAVDLVVLDEADRMADMGFMPAVRRLLDRTPDRRQTLLFSATLDGDVDKLVRRYQHDPVHHAAAGADDDDVEVAHHFWTVAREERVAVTADIVHRAGSTIVFTRTRHGADRVTRQLARYGVKAVAIHGRRTPGAARPGAAAVQHRAGARAGGHRRGRPRHPRRRRGVRRALRPARRTQGLRAPLGPHRPRRRLGHGGGARWARTPARTPAPCSAPSAAPSPSSPPTPSGCRPPSPSPVLRWRSPTVPSALGAIARGGATIATSAAAAPRTTAAPRRPGPTGARVPTGTPRRAAPAAPTARTASSAGAVATASCRARCRASTPSRGYGFISRRGGGDVFVHVSALAGREPSLEPGQRVRFELAPGKRGQQARNVRAVT